MEPRFLQWNGIKTPPPWLTSNHQSGAVRGVLHWCQLALHRQPWPMWVQGGVCNHACYPSSFWASINRSLVYNSLWPHGLYSPPDSSVHGILQAKILEWVSPRDTPSPGMELQSPAFQRDSLLPEPPVYIIQWPFCISLNCPSPFFLQIFTTTVSYCILHSVGTMLQPLDLGLLLHSTPWKELRSWYKMQFLKKTLKPLP